MAGWTKVNAREARFTDLTHEIKMFSEIGNYYEKGIFLDMTFICKNNAVVRAHKFVICAASLLVKQAVKSADVQPGMDTHVSLPEVGHREMRLLLNFLYTGMTKLSEEELQSFNSLCDMLLIDKSNFLRTRDYAPIDLLESSQDQQVSDHNVRIQPQSEDPLNVPDMYRAVTGLPGASVSQQTRVQPNFPIQPRLNQQVPVQPNINQMIQRLPNVNQIISASPNVNPIMQTLSNSNPFMQMQANLNQSLLYPQNLNQQVPFIPNGSQFLPGVFPHLTGSMGRMPAPLHRIKYEVDDDDCMIIDNEADGSGTKFSSNDHKDGSAGTGNEPAPENKQSDPDGGPKKTPDSEEGKPDTDTKEPKASAKSPQSSSKSPNAPVENNSRKSLARTKKTSNPATSNTTSGGDKNTVVTTKTCETRSSGKFTSKQYAKLEKVYSHNPQPDADVIKQLSKELNLRPLQLRAWFINRKRRL